MLQLYKTLQKNRDEVAALVVAALASDDHTSKPYVIAWRTRRAESPIVARKGVFGASSKDAREREKCVKIAIYRDDEKKSLRRRRHRREVAAAVEDTPTDIRRSD